MLQFLHIIVISVIVVVINGIIVNSHRLCDFSSYISRCPGDDNQLKIRYPFWKDNRTADDQGGCSTYPEFQIKCAANGRPVINTSNNLYYVLNIEENYPGGKLTVMDVATDAQECPQPQQNFSLKSVRFFGSSANQNINMTIFYNCSRHPENAVQHIPYLARRSFAFIDEEISSHGFDWYSNCEKTVVVPVTRPGDRTKMNYTGALKGGFQMAWRKPVSCEDCRISGGQCFVNETGQVIESPFLFCNCKDNITVVDDVCANSYQYVNPYAITKKAQRIGIAVLVGVGLLLLLLLAICIRCCYSICSCLRKKIKSLSPTNAEVFLENYGELSLQRLKYSDIKKVTNSFKDKLGQGGFGSVFKGKLRDGQLVAVKVLNESKGKGEDFINEVITIGRTNHVNVVSLLGFCLKGTKQALVYEFMPNGSLDKFIFSGNEASTTNPLLGWEKLHQIALGIARGLEYLHRGCNARILHLDIKPHNILLDQNFCPKISDFGLAKLCPTKESLVPMTRARGTIGYIAPEVCCGNYGGVSHKSDVYSFGMMTLEMIGRRKNIDIMVSKTSEIHFPRWIYERLKENIKAVGSEKNDIVVPGEVVFEEETTKKMTLVALWCIQPHPGDRPSMNRVVDMLEGNIEDLQLPPNPFPHPSSHSSSLP